MSIDQLKPSIFQSTCDQIPLGNIQRASSLQSSELISSVQAVINHTLNSLLEQVAEEEKDPCFFLSSYTSEIEEVEQKNVTSCLAKV